MSIIDLITEIKHYGAQCESIREYYSFVNEEMKNKTDENRFYHEDYLNLTPSQLSFIKGTILESSYPDELKPLSKRLLEYTDTSNLLICALNLGNVSLIRDKKYRAGVINLFNKKLAGSYDSKGNVIYYYDEDCLPHEFLHMSSTPIRSEENSWNTCGFNIYYNNIDFGRGFNEGYTELLSRRIFFNQNYDTLAYRTNVYLLRLFELLYDDCKNMERAYFWGNYQSPINIFLKFGSLEEFFELSKYLDWFAKTGVFDDEDIKVFNLLKSVIKRTGNQDKIILANQIADEYLQKTKIKHTPTFLLKKKRH